jgi:hypothetical protein
MVIVTALLQANTRGSSPEVIIMAVLACKRVMACSIGYNSHSTLYTLHKYVICCCILKLE